MHKTNTVSPNTNMSQVQFMTHDEIRRYQDNNTGLVDCDALAVRPTDVWAGGGDDASQSERRYERSGYLTCE